MTARHADRRVTAAMSALIEGTYGCLDAAAETINARLDETVSKGTLSKYCAGHLHWPASYIFALEDAAGRYPVSRLRARDVAGRMISAPADLYASAGVASKEAGEAIAAALSAGQSADAGDLAEALQEAREAEAAMRRLADAIEARLHARGQA